MDCLFCKFVNKELKTEVVYEDDHVLGFKDISPMAPVHILFVPKVHSRDVGEMSEKGHDINSLYKAINIYTREENLTEKGYRVVTNKGDFAGQTVFHTHFHLLSGAPLKGFGA